jgi:hypothetical protein
MLIRDFGADAHSQAMQLAQQAHVEQNDIAVRLWNAVADEIAMRDMSKLH